MREFGTRMLLRAPREGRRREHLCRKSLPCPAGLSRGGRLPAAGRFRPSQWREGAGTCTGLSGEWVLCVAPTAASLSDGRPGLNSASSLVVPSPLPLRGARHGGPRCPARWGRAIARAVGFLAGPARVSGRIWNPDTLTYTEVIYSVYDPIYHALTYGVIYLVYEGILFFQKYIPSIYRYIYFSRKVHDVI